MYFFFTARSLALRGRLAGWLAVSLPLIYLPLFLASFSVSLSLSLSISPLFFFPGSSFHSSFKSVSNVFSFLSCLFLFPLFLYFLFRLVFPLPLAVYVPLSFYVASINVSLIYCMYFSSIFLFFSYVCYSPSSLSPLSCYKVFPGLAIGPLPFSTILSPPPRRPKCIERCVVIVLFRRSSNQKRIGVRSIVSC